MRLIRIILAGALLFAGFHGNVFAETYKVDIDHSTIGFKIRHLFSKVSGNFKQFEGVIEYTPEKPETWKVEGSVKAASINTNVEARDNHLRGADFFDVDKFPLLTFKSTGVTDVTGSTAKLNGVLNLHGVEKPVTMDLEFHGEGKDPWGNIRAGFTAKTTINRKDFGLNWNEVVESGGVLVGEEVELILEIEAIKQVPKAA